MSSYRDLFQQEENKRHREEEQRKLQEQERKRHEQEVRQDLLAKIQQLDAEIREILRAYGEVHLSGRKYVVSDKPEIHYRSDGMVTSVRWKFMTDDNYADPERQANIGVSLDVDGQRILGFRIVGTDGRSRAEPTVNDLASALASSRPAWSEPPHRSTLPTAPAIRVSPSLTPTAPAPHLPTATQSTQRQKNAMEKDKGWLRKLFGR